MFMCNVHMYVIMYVCTYIYICMYELYVCVNVCMYVYVCMCVCMYVYMCVYVCMYVRGATQKFREVDHEKAFYGNS